MFINPLPDNEDFRVYFTGYAERHFIRRFEKDYRGKRWYVTRDSIFQDLKRIHAIQNTQQVDELKLGINCRLVKYDFAVAQSGISPKASGNRCILFIDLVKRRIYVLLLYGKNDLPKNISETQYIKDKVKSEFPEFWSQLD